MISRKGEAPCPLPPAELSHGQEQKYKCCSLCGVFSVAMPKPQNPLGKQKQAGPYPGRLLFLPSLHPPEPHAAFPPRCNIYRGSVTRVFLKARFTLRLLTVLRGFMPHFPQCRV